MNNLFPADLIEKAKFYFHTVYDNDTYVRVWYTGWQYETEIYFYSAADLENSISRYEQWLMDTFDFVDPDDLRELGILL